MYNPLVKTLTKIIQLSTIINVKAFYEQFKTSIVTIVLIFLALMIYTKVIGPIPFSVNSINTTKTDLFTATGEGQITAIPDSATVDAGVTKTAATVADAQNQVNSTTDKLIADIKKLGISDKDIKTTNYSVTPNYGGGIPVPNDGTEFIPPSRGNNITGYTVTQNLQVKVNDTKKVNNVIDTATNDGANLVGGANFTFSDETQAKLEKQATEMAVKAAKTKANDLANAAGIKLGRVVNVTTSSTPIYRPMMAAGVAEKTDTTQASNVTPGQNTVTVDVTLSYETY
jgi:uncharacterized protein